MDAQPTSNVPETTARDEAPPSKQKVHTRLPLAIGQAYEQF